MPPQVIEEFTAEVTATKGVIESAVVLINGISGRIQAEVDAALAGGATAEQLAGFEQLKTDLAGKREELAAAVAANS